MDSIFLPQVNSLKLADFIPYAILLVNFILFKTLRYFVDTVFAYYLFGQRQQTTTSNNNKPIGNQSSKVKKNGVNVGGPVKFAKLFLDELISTLELCADCAELNVVYEKHGSLAYGSTLFVLTYLWIDAFGEAQTSPAYLVEGYFLDDGNQLLKTGSTYARFIGQSLAMPLAWRFASFYWKYRLIGEHEQMLNGENCKSALNTSTINGFFVEFTCCLLCRLLELIGHKLLERQHLSQRFVSILSSFVCTALVVLALELSGGYFNPVLAASLEYGCKGIHFYQHALVFWMGPLLGHVTARSMFRRFFNERNHLDTNTVSQHHRSSSKKSTAAAAREATSAARRLTRANSQRKKRLDKID